LFVFTKEEQTMRIIILVLMLIALVSSEPVRILSSKKGPKVYVSPEESPNEFIMEDDSQVEGLAQVKDEPIRPYYTGPAMHGNKGTPGASFIDESDKSNQKIKNLISEGMARADIIPGFDSSNPVMVPVLRINQQKAAVVNPATPLSATTTTNNNNNNNNNDIDQSDDPDVVALEKQAKIEEEDLNEIKAKINDKKKGKEKEKEMMFKEKLENLENEKQNALINIKLKAAEQERLVLEQAAEEASKLTQEQIKTKSEKKRVGQAVPSTSVSKTTKTSSSSSSSSTISIPQEVNPRPFISTKKNNDVPLSLLEQSSNTHVNKKVVRMREVIQKKKDTKKDTTEEDEDLKEARAKQHLVNTITSTLTDDANQAEMKAEQESHLAHQDLSSASDNNDGWSYLRTATKHITDAATYLKQKEDDISFQNSIQNSQQENGTPTENTSTTITLVDPNTKIDESFIQINKNYVMKMKTEAKPARSLMATIKQMRSKKL